MVYIFLYIHEIFNVNMLIFIAIQQFFTTTTIIIIIIIIIIIEQLFIHFIKLCINEISVTSCFLCNVGIDVTSGCLATTLAIIFTLFKTSAQLPLLTL